MLGQKIVNNILGSVPKVDVSSKNKTLYKLLWKGEVIEEDIDTLEEAEFLKQEYNLAYKGGVAIRRQ